MKRPRLINLLWITTGLVVGLLGRTWLRSVRLVQPPSIIAVSGGTPQHHTPTEQVTILYPTEPESLASLTSTQWAALLDECRRPSGSNVMQRQAVFELRLLRSCRTNADFERGLQLLQAMPYSLDELREWTHSIVGIVEVMAHHWAKLDLPRALAGLEFEGNLIGSDAVRWAISELHPMETNEAALATLRTLLDNPNRKIRAAAPQMILDIVTQRNHLDGLRLLFAMTAQFPNVEIEESLVTCYLSTPEECAAGLSCALAAAQGQVRSAVLSMVICRTTTTLAARLERLAALPLHESEQSALRENFISSATPNEALPIILQETDPATRKTLLEKLSQRTTGDLASLQSVFQLLPLPEDRTLFFANSFSKKYHALPLEDMAPLAALIGALPPSESQRRSYERLLNQWVSADSASASEWVASLPAGATREMVVTEFCRHIDGRDPAAALAWSATLTDQRNRERTATDALETWWQSDPTATIQWLDQQPLGTHRDKMIASIAFNRVVNGSPEAALAISEILTTPNATDALLTNVYQEWAKTDPVGAKDWLLSTPRLSDSVKANCLTRP